MNVWTPELEEQLGNLWAMGLTASQIAERIGGGITRNAVIGKRIRLGLPDREANRRPCAAAGRKAATKFRAVRDSARRRKGGIAADPIASAIPSEVFGYKACIERFQADASEHLVQIADLEAHHCRAPIGEPTIGCCGAPKAEGLVYCERHAERFLLPADVRPKRRFVKFRADAREMEVAV